MADCRPEHGHAAVEASHNLCSSRILLCFVSAAASAASFPAARTSTAASAWPRGALQHCYAGSGIRFVHRVYLGAHTYTVSR